MQLTNNINKFTFRGYDIRGVYPTDLNEDVAYTIGKAYGTHIQTLGKNKCVIGYDNRLSSVELYNGLTKGILETGVDIVSVGLVSIPMYYYACLFYQIPSGIMITGSHNPKNENGFKIAFDNYDNACGDAIQDFYKLTISLDFKEGSGKLEHANIENDYLKLIKSSIDLGDKRIKAVVDCGNGTTSIIVRKVFEMFNIDVTYLFDESDATFPNHHPDPSVESNLTFLKNKVLEIGADVGLAFDGDGDRIGVIDEKGGFIRTDKYMIIIWRDIMNKVSNKKALYDVKCTKALEDEIVKLGGIPFCYRTGNSYTKNKVKSLDLAFGGEFSGHVFFRDRFPGIDDGIYAGLRLVEILSKTNKTTSMLLDGINIYYETGEIKIPSPDDIKFEVVERVKQYCIEKNYNILTIDGVKVLFDDGFALIRASNTGPNLLPIFEAKTKERLDEIQNEFMSLINEYNKKTTS